MFCNIVVLALQFSLAFSFFYFSPHLLSFSSPPFPFFYVCLSIPPIFPPPNYLFQIFYFCVLLVLHLLFFLSLCLSISSYHSLSPRLSLCIELHSSISVVVKTQSSKSHKTKNKAPIKGKILIFILLFNYIYIIHAMHGVIANSR